MDMKKILFLTYDWNNEVVRALAEGVERFLSETNEYAVHFVDAFGNYGSEVAEKGDFQIFNLPVFNEYDGLIIQGNRVWKPEFRQIVADRAIALGLPVVSINYPLKGCVNVTSDNFNAVKQIVEHLINEHHVQSLAFVRGLHTSAEAKMREQAFIESCKENHISHYYSVDGGTWSEELGALAAQTFIRTRALPDGIVCANDDLALGLIQALKKNGYRVPEDTLVTGFDHLGISESCNPTITTVDRDYATVSYTAMNVIESCVNRETIEQVIHSRSAIVKGGSCGCSNRESEAEEIRNDLMKITKNVKHFYRVHDVLKHQLEHTSSLAEVMDVFEKNASEMSDENLYVIINGKYIDHYEQSTPVKDFGSQMYLMAMADGNQHKMNGLHIYEMFDRRTILPESLLHEKQFLKIYPLRYDEIMIGYVVMDGKSGVNEYNFLEMLFSLIDSAIENVHRANVMNRLNGQLSDLYVRDQLTGLYNRFGLEKYGEPIFKNVLKEKKELVVSFIDIDRMKTINDFYGHEAGDKAIMMTAAIIKRAVRDTNHLAIRYGGDEFVILTDKDISEELVDAYLETVEEFPQNFSYTLSHGMQVVKGDMFVSLQDAIDAADNEMYSIKKIKNDIY